MKKLIAALAVCLVVVCLFTACAAKDDPAAAPQTEQTAPVTEQTTPVTEQTEAPVSGVPNPLVETDADGVIQQLGFALKVPDGAENVQYFILSGDTEELRFTLNGLDYTARLKPTVSFEDISGMYYEWTDTMDDELKGRECKLMRYCGSDGDIDLCMWYDAVPGLMYSITTSDSSLDGFDITAIALQVFEPMQHEN